MSPLELVDDRFEQLARELRASRPLASDPLRERVRALEPPPPPRHPPLRLRRVLPAVALGAVAVSLSAAVGIGLVHSSSTPGENFRASARPSTTNVGGPAPDSRAAEKGSPLTLAPARVGRGSGAFTLDRVRLQQYAAVVTLRVDDRSDLSARTSQAMRLTRVLGGYVASAVYNVPGKHGASSLALRIPVDRVQQALEAFSGYGTLVSQRISVKDVQRRVDDIGSTIAVLREEVARIERELSGSVTPARRAELEQRLASDRGRIKALTSTKRAITKRAELARVSLTLVTPRTQAVAAKSRFDRTLDDAGSVLARELQILLYALVVAGPLLALGAVAIGTGRAQRRRSDRRLLERA